MASERSGDLLLVWKQPQSRERFLIGRLWHDGEKYLFRYELSQPRSLMSAVQAGFRLLDSFPDTSKEWVATELFPTFRRRLPPAWRHSNVSPIGASPDKALGFLRLTGGRLPTDTFEFLEPIRTASSREQYQLRFPVAGWRYYRGEQVIHELTVGTKVTLELEPNNPYDRSATRVLSPSGVHVGYVPAIYAWFLDDVVSKGNYEAKVQEVGPAEDPQVRVIVSLTGATPLPAKPFPDGLENYVATLPQ